MKSIIKYIRIPGFLIIFLFSACGEDFLERYPLDSMSDATFFNSANDLKVLANGFYRMLPRYHYQRGGMAHDGNNMDVASDILAFASPNGNLMRRGASGQAPDADGTWNSSWDWIRQINYLIKNADRVPNRGMEVSHYIGEGYFFRAWVYYGMLTTYGDVPFITTVLGTSDEELYRTRDSRHDVARGIIKDLDSAIVNLSWKGQGPASGAGRVNKESAIVLKARVALFEGTWERYHSRAGTPFAVSGKTGEDLLQLVAPAVQELINHQGTNIFTNGGPLNEPYNQLRSQLDGTQVPGVFLYRVYDATQIVGHNFFDKVVNAPSFTDRIVNAYLDKDGMPQALSALPIDHKSLYSQGANLDPRFRQTIWTPDKGPMYEIPGFAGATFIPLARYPHVSISQNDYWAETGYRAWKGAILDAFEWRNGSTDDVLLRYAEALLAYAEAKAILGTINQADLDMTVNLLRDRVGMAHINLAEVNSWPGSLYTAQEAYDPSEPNIVNEIRRERLVELCWEGRRLNDLKRWAVYEDAINGYRPKGAHIDQFLNYWNSADSLVNDGYNASDAAGLAITIGDRLEVDGEGYLNPFYTTPEFDEGGEGYYIDPDRDYLSPIPRAQIDLYQEKGGITLAQNPGWF
jgi:hypothetical protein